MGSLKGQTSKHNVSEAVLSRRLKWIQEQLGAELTSHLLSVHNQYHDKTSFMDATKPADSKGLMVGLGENYPVYHRILCDNAQTRKLAVGAVQHNTFLATKNLDQALIHNVGESLFDGYNLFRKKWDYYGEEISFLNKVQAYVTQFGDESTISATKIYNSLPKLTEWDVEVKTAKTTMDGQFTKLDSFLSGLDVEEFDREDMLLTMAAVAKDVNPAISEILRSSDTFLQKEVPLRQFRRRLRELTDHVRELENRTSDEYTAGLQRSWVRTCFSLNNQDYDDLDRTLTSLHSLEGDFIHECREHFMVSYEKNHAKVEAKLPGLQPIILDEVTRQAMTKKGNGRAHNFYMCAASVLLKTDAALFDELAHMYRNANSSYLLTRKLQDHTPAIYKRMKKAGASTEQIKKGLGFVSQVSRLGLDHGGASLFALPYIFEKEGDNFEVACAGLLDEGRLLRRKSKYDDSISTRLMGDYGVSYWQDHSRGASWFETRDGWRAGEKTNKRGTRYS